MLQWLQALHKREWRKLSHNNDHWIHAIEKWPDKNFNPDGLTGFKVMDCCCVTNCSPTATVPERLEALKRTVARDDIHFTSAGYRNLSERAINCMKSLMDAPKRILKSMNHFWRGFQSARSSTMPRACLGSMSHGSAGTSRGAIRGLSRGANPGSRTRSFHPYRRW
jgi:hypothetical protein